MSDAPPWKAWYKTAEWRALRRACFERDKWRCQRTGALCRGKHPEPDAPVANHKVPHRGRRELFFDLANLETVSKSEHDGPIQRAEQASLAERGCWY